MLQAYWQNVFGCPIRHPQTCLTVTGWQYFTDLIVPEMLLVLGAEVLLYLHIPSKNSAQTKSQIFWFWWAQPIHETSFASEGFLADVNPP